MGERRGRLLSNGTENEMAERVWGNVRGGCHLVLFLVNIIKLNTRRQQCKLVQYCEWLFAIASFANDKREKFPHRIIFLFPYDNQLYQYTTVRVVSKFLSRV